jgi:hypothetical protein
MNGYAKDEKETLIGTLMLCFVGISAFVGLIPLGYVLVWFFRQCL